MMHPALLAFRRATLWTALMVGPLLAQDGPHASRTAAPDAASSHADSDSLPLASALTHAGYVAIPLTTIFFSALNTVPAHIRSTDQALIFDSGFSGALNLDKTLADSLGITGTPHNTLVGVGGEGGMTDTTSIGGFFLGTLPLDTQELRIIPDLRSHVPASGSVGAVLLDQYSGIVDYVHAVLYLRPPTAAGVTALPIVDETRGTVAIPLIKTTVERPRKGATYSMKVSINGKPATLLLDTGASISVLDQAAADALQIPSEASPVSAGGVSGRQPMRTATLDRLEIGAVTLTQAPIITTDMSVTNKREVSMGLASFDGILGIDVLTKLGAVIDFGHKVLYLHQPATP